LHLNDIWAILSGRLSATKNDKGTNCKNAGKQSPYCHTECGSENR